MRSAGLLPRPRLHHELQDGTTRHAFEAATIGGAKILRRPDLGRLSPGAKADFSLVDMSHPYMQPSHEPVRSLIYSAGEARHPPRLCRRRQVVKDGKVLTVDVEAATAASSKRSATPRHGQPARLGRPHRRSTGTAGLCTKERLPQSRPVT